MLRFLKGGVVLVYIKWSFDLNKNYFIVGTNFVNSFNFNTNYGFYVHLGLLTDRATENRRSRGEEEPINDDTLRFSPTSVAMRTNGEAMTEGGDREARRCAVRYSGCRDQSRSSVGLEEAEETE